MRRKSLLLLVTSFICCAQVEASSKGDLALYDKQGRSSLYFAIMHGNVTRARHFIRLGCYDVNRPWLAGSVVADSSEEELPSCERALCLYAESEKYNRMNACEIVSVLMRVGCSFTWLRCRDRRVRVAVHSAGGLDYVRDRIWTGGHLRRGWTYEEKVAPDIGFNRILHIVVERKLQDYLDGMH